MPQADPESRRAEPAPTALLFGPYLSTRVKRGDRTYCRYRSYEVVSTVCRWRSGERGYWEEVKSAHVGHIATRDQSDVVGARRSAPPRSM